MPFMIDFVNKSALAELDVYRGVKTTKVIEQFVHCK